MEWKIDKNRPICPQLEEMICVCIANGTFKPGEKMTSVREFAVSVSVNPNTVQKAFEGLEQKGLLSSVRRSGWYITENTELSQKILLQTANAKTEEYLSAMEMLGFDSERVIKIIKENY